MVMNINYDEPVVSEFLASDGSVTVPTGEVWFVTMHTGERGTSAGGVYINGIETLGGEGGSNYIPNTGPLKTVLAPGDEITADNRIYISGFDVSDAVGNNVVSVALGSSETVTVPSGETWKVTVSTANNSSSYITIEHTDGLEYDVATYNRIDGGRPNDAIIPAGSTIFCENSGHIGGLVI